MLEVQASIDIDRPPQVVFDYIAEQLVVEGDLISTRWRATGTHDGPLDNIEPTGKKIDINGQVIMRFEGSKIAEEWESFDEVAMLQQIGEMPA